MFGDRSDWGQTYDLNYYYLAKSCYLADFILINILAIMRRKKVGYLNYVNI